MRAPNWSRALDIQMEQLKWQHLREGQFYTEAFFADFLTKRADEKITDAQLLYEGQQLNRNLRITLARGDTIFVTTDMMHVLEQAAHDLPDHVRLDLHSLITPVGFAMFEEPMHGEDVNGQTVGISAIAWHVAPVDFSNLSVDGKRFEEESDKAIVVYFFTDTNDTLDDINKELIPWMRAKNLVVPPLSLMHFYPTFDGSMLPQPRGLKGAELICGAMKLFWAMQLLAQQRIGEPVRMQPDRPTRKRFMRDFPDEPMRMITLITLRRKSVKKDDDNNVPVPWSHRWVVRGHWRKQPYGTKKDKWRWVYIYEHVKGPEDKPLIITERRVFNFRR